MPFIVLLILALLLDSRAVSAAAGPIPDITIEMQVNIPYVIQFGFGSYSVGGLSTDAYRIPLATTIPLGKEPDDWRLKLAAFIGYGHVDFETGLFGPKLTATQDYCFVLPQLELQIPLGTGWQLKPYLAAGLGYAFNGSFRLEGYQKESTGDGFGFLYAAGVGSLYELPPFGQTLTSIGGKLGWAEDMPGGQGFATLQLGVEVRQPLGLRIKGHVLDLAASFIYYHFAPAARFSMPAAAPMEVSNQYEFGLNLGFSKPFSLWFIDDPRLGASYRFGDGLSGFRVNLGFPF